MIDARTTGTAEGWTTPLWRGVIVFRIASLVYATILVTYNHKYLSRPGLAAAALIGMALWTAWMSITNGTARGRRWWWSALDLAVATGMLLLTEYVDKPDGLLARSLTLTGPWTGPSVLSCALLGGPWVGLLATIPVIAATIILPGPLVTADTSDNLVLLVTAAGSLGLVVRLLERAQERTRRYGS